MARQIFFYCNALDDRERHARAIVSDSPAATRKIVGICLALRSVGVRCTMVSMGRGKADGSGRYHRPHAARLEGVPVVYGPMSHRRMLSPLLSLLWLAAMAWRLRRRRNAVHLFYNQLTAYLPALLCLRAAGCRTAVDIEDGPIDHATYRSAAGDAPPALFARLIDGGALLACTALATGTRIRPVLPYYGTIDRIAPPRADGGPDVDVIYPGYLARETGSELLAAALQLLHARDAALAQRLRVHVTGTGPGLDRMRELAATLNGPVVEVHGRLDRREYDRLIAGCDAGLSLKLRASGLSESTFPSKTIEFAQHGLTLVATDISDVRLLFGDTAAYVERDDPAELADALEWLVRSCGSARDRAEAAQRMVAERLAPAAAGRKLERFLFDGVVT